MDWYIQQWDDYAFEINTTGWMIATDTNYPPGTNDCDFDTFEEAVERARSSDITYSYIIVKLEKHLDVVRGNDGVTTVTPRPLKSYLVICHNFSDKKRLLTKKSRWFFKTSNEATEWAMKKLAFAGAQRSVVQVSDYKIFEKFP